MGEQRHQHRHNDGHYLAHLQPGTASLCVSVRGMYCQVSGKEWV